MENLNLLNEQVELIFKYERVSVMRKYHEILVKATETKNTGNHLVVVAGKQQHITTDKEGRVIVSYTSRAYTTETEWLDETTGGYVDVEGTRIFYYHYNPIVCVDDRLKTYKTTHAGWHTTSTTQAINGYKEYFDKLGYTHIK